MKRSTIITAAALTLALAGTGTALAATTSIPDSSGVIHGCYANKGGALSVIDTDAGQSCPKGTTGLNWNQQGPAGQSTSFYVVTAGAPPSAIGIQPGDNLAETVICNTGDHAVGGGGSAANQGPNEGLVTIDETYPSNSGATDNAWTTDIKNNATGLVDVIFYAECAHGG